MASINRKHLDTTTETALAGRAQQAADQVRRQILQGQWAAPGQRFAPVRELALKMGISLVTAHKAVSLLKTQGILIGDSTRRPIVNPELAAEISTISFKTSKRLGMVVTNTASPFYAQLCHYVQQIASRMGHQVLIASSEYDLQREQRIVQSFLEIGVQGILASPGVVEQASEIYRPLLNRNDVRLVFVARQMTDLAVDSVLVHNFLGGTQVVDHLWSLGHRRYGFIGFYSKLVNEQRLAGYRSALHEKGIELADSQIVLATGWQPSAGYQAMDQLMQLPDDQRPTAVFAFHDLLAVGALRYTQDHGIKVPDQVAIVGFDNLPESRVTQPGLSTVDYPIRSMAELAVQMVCQSPSARADREPHTVFLQPKLIVRRSSDPAAPAAALDMDGDYHPPLPPLSAHPSTSLSAPPTATLVAT